MTLTASEITQALNAVVFNKFPSKDVKLAGTTFRFLFTPEPIPPATPELVDYFKPLVSVREISGEEFLTSLPVPLFITLFLDYSTFHYTTSARLSELVRAFSETPESMNVWDIFKNAGPNYALTLKGNHLSSLQYLWVLHNVRKDTRNKYDLITSVLDALKPWLNTELYVKMQEQGGATRKNYLYDDDEMDTKLQRQADTILKKKAPPVAEDDLDIVEIEGDDNG